MRPRTVAAGQKGRGKFTTKVITDILDVWTTVSYLRATLIRSNNTGGRIVPVPNEPPNSQLALRIAQADAAIEQFHIDQWSAIGGSPITTTFTRTPGDAATLEARQHVHVGTYLAAARQFSKLDQPLPAKWAFQAGAIEAEDRAIFRFIQDLSGAAAANPPNNKAFEKDLIIDVADTLGLFRSLGLIGGSGPFTTYPGRGAVLAAAGPMADGLLQKVINDSNSTLVFTGPVSVLGERA